jgi:hypothetical protein
MFVPGYPVELQTNVDTVFVDHLRLLEDRSQHRGGHCEKIEVEYSSPLYKRQIALVIVEDANDNRLSGERWRVGVSFQLL